MAILTTDKEDFITRNTAWDKEATSPRRHNNPKYIGLKYIKLQNT